MKVEQFSPSLGHRDAVGNHILQTQRALRGAGIAGGIWAEDIHPENARAAQHYLRYRPKHPHGTILYQASTGSSGMADFVLSRPEAKTLYYHNITPASFFEPYDLAAAVNLARGREELARLAPTVRTAMANSAYSARELCELGVEDVRVVPPYLPAGIDAEPDRALASWLRRTKRGLDILFVSRLAPHKGHLHLLRTYAAVCAAVDPGARLFVVGAWGPDAYMRAVFALRDRLHLPGVAFTGSISPASLAAFYRDCDVFVCLSEHEGFGLPIVEAMRQHMPVVAYDAAAVGETLDGSGVLVRTLDPALIAEVIGRVSTDETLRASLVGRQDERVRTLEGVDRDAATVAALQDSGSTVAR